MSTQGNHIFSEGFIPWFLGAGFMQVWFSVVFQNALAQGGEAFFPFYLLRAFTALIAAAAVLIFGNHTSSVPVKSARAVCLVLCLLTVLAAVPAVMASPIARIGMFAVFGAGLTWIFLLYVMLYMRVPEREAMCYILLWFLLSGIVGSLLQLLPLKIATLASCFFPPLAAWFLERGFLSTGAIGPTPPGPPKEDRAPHLIRRLTLLYISLAVCGFVVGQIRLISVDVKGEPESLVISLLLQMAIGIALFVFFGLKKHAFDADMVLEGIFFVLVGAVLVISQSLEVHPDISVYVSWCMRVGLIMMLWLVLISHCNSLSLHPMATFGLGWGIYMACLLAGSAAASAKSLTGESESSLLWLAYLAFAFVFVIIESIRRRDERMRVQELQVQLAHVLRDAEAQESPPTADDAESALARTLDAASKNLARHYDLSERETEIIVLTCRGYSKRAIGEQLFLSENTVKFHLKQVYLKMGIHSKDELLAALKL